MENNPAAWSMIAGALGLGDNTESGPAPRSSPAVAAQTAQIHAHYLGQLEDAFYSSLYHRRLQAAGVGNNGNKMQPPTQTTPSPMPGNNSLQQAQQATNSAQFLEAVAKSQGNMAMLNDQQRRILEARRISAASTGTGQTPQTPTMMAMAMNNQYTLPPGLNGQSYAAVKQNPISVFQWIRAKEESTRNKFRECSL